MDMIKNSEKKADATDELDLVYGIDPNSIYISETAGTQEINSIAFNIANPHQTAQVFDNPDNLKPTDDLPSYGESYDKYNLSLFFIWFPWGSGKGNFATSEAGDNITVSPASDNYEWFCVKKSNKSIGTYWTLFPKKSTVIDPMQSIAFIIENIVSLTPEGMSYMYVESHKIPGFSDARVSQTIWKKKKVVELAINSFYFDPGTIAKGANATLKWETVGSKSCVINPGNINVALSGQMELYPDEDKTYILRANDGEKSCQANAQIYIGDVSIESFEAVPANVEKRGDSFTLKWKTLYASNCAIDNGIGIVEDVGSHIIYPENPVKYTITCNGKNGPVQKTVEIETMWERVDWFGSLIECRQVYGENGGQFTNFYSHIQWYTSHFKILRLQKENTEEVLSCDLGGDIEVPNAEATYLLVGEYTALRLLKKGCPDRIDGWVWKPP